MAPTIMIPLPQVHYTVADPTALIPAAVLDQQSESFGFNSGTEWEYAQPDTDARYIRWLQPMESALSTQVEYDMDEQDQAWLDALNNDRKKDGHQPVSSEMFEILFDKLEKEWFDLTKSIPKKASALPSEDSKCAICDDGECENSNAIVFCDGCNLAVHQDCYGVPYIPEGQWLCRKCTVSPDKPVSCVLCPNSYGAFKQTTTSQWAHLLCAIWVPDTGVSNTVYMEPIDGVENISKNRWKLICFLCRKRTGACIQCANKSCFTAFHVTCARERGLDMKVKSVGGAQGEMRAYCDKHSPGIASMQVGSALKKSKSKSTGSLPKSLLLKHSAHKSSKSARAYKQTYSSGPPLIPAYIFNRLMEYTAKIKIPRKAHFVDMVCRYWSLKRESRRGAPLLKRLHLEPWTATASSRHQTDAEREKKLQLIQHLRQDLERVRMLTERVGKREKKKLERVVLFKKVIDEFIFPKDRWLKAALDRIILLDKNHIFAQPVSRIQAPDYYDVIKLPMDWNTMSDKLDRHEYLTATEFQDDVELVLNNARMYNKNDSFVHKMAIRVGELAEPILAELDSLDRTDSTINQRAAELIAALTDETIEDLFDYSLPDPNAVDSPSPPPTPLVPLPTPFSLKIKPLEAPTPIASTSAAVPVHNSRIIPPSKDKRKKSHKRKRASEASGLNQDAPVIASTSTSTRDPFGAPVSKKHRPSHPSSGGVAVLPPTSPPKSSKKVTKASSTVVTVPPLVKRSHQKKVPATTMGIALAPPIASTSSTATDNGSQAPSSSKKAVLLDQLRLKIVNEVDVHSSFKLFEEGWVLPEGATRRQTITNPDESISVLSPPPASKVQLLATAPTPVPSRKGKEKAVEVVAIVPPPPVRVMSRRGQAIDEDIVMVDGTTASGGGVDAVDAEVEDHGAEKGESRAGTGSPAKSKSSKKSKGKHGERNKSDVTGGGGGSSKAALKEAWTKRLQDLSPSVQAPEKGVIEDGTLVWAKATGFPPFPAEVADPNDLEGTPQDLVRRKPTTVGANSLVLVMFFDMRRTGAWVARKDLRMLGENLELDELLQSSLTLKSSTKGKANGAQATQIVEAYKKAMATIATEEEELSNPTVVSVQRRKRKA